ncbi:hypothetical protein Ddye_024496 [Dipteronia dyeriana]|uniref:Uncharacterized protein n=1 Tax=Dipteronia dyeriana TaxID=168575 RepID=A0AAD9TVK4_9ROSI|nr:hypothetical protein Ddye_024496 [Dipteronia dyeriana]
MEILKHDVQRGISTMLWKWVRDELLRESIRHGHAAVRNDTRFERDEFQDLASFYQRDYLAAGYKSGSASSQLQDEFHNHSSQQERIKLLKLTGQVFGVPLKLPERKCTLLHTIVLRYLRKKFLTN